MSIYRDQLWYDNSTDTLNVNAKLTTTATITQPNYKVVSTVSATQSIPSGTATAVAFTTDTRTNWPVRSDNTRFVAPAAGTYAVSILPQVQLGVTACLSY